CVLNPTPSPSLDSPCPVGPASSPLSSSSSSLDAAKLRRSASWRACLAASSSSTSPASYVTASPRPPRNLSFPSRSSSFSSASSKSSSFSLFFFPGFSFALSPLPSSAPELP
ncbi:hypothetical protein Vretimale_15767, partial [Volvox reticuliferus]